MTDDEAMMPDRHMCTGTCIYSKQTNWGYMYAGKIWKLNGH